MVGEIKTPARFRREVVRRLLVLSASLEIPSGVVQGQQQGQQVLAGCNHTLGNCSDGEGWGQGFK